MTQTTMFNPVLYRMIIPLVVILLTMLGYKAPFFYALALFIVAPTVLAILANRWEQQDIAFRETSLDIVYTQYNWIHVPVEDERVYLSNIFFRQQSILAQKLLMAARIKMVVYATVALVALNDSVTAWTQFNRQDPYSIASFAGAIIWVAAAGWLNVRTLELYQRIARQDYQVKSITIAEKQLYTAVMETRTAGDEPVMAGLLRGY